MNLAALESRLDNWARAQRSGGSGGASIASAEGMYRRPGVLYRDETRVLHIVDHTDALIVNSAWQRLLRLDQDVLKYHYVRRASPMVILRQLGLLRTPPKLHDAHVRAWLRAKRVFLQRYKLSHDDTFDYAIWHARNAIAEQLGKIEANL
ncbi:hypothetical protein [Paraburkholderia bannensis]|uniref:hypothetical protein n=1 Tax=Paraburkholderia bannensis TaxID=765414 RepID=UPI002AB69ADB|nr:hypothetical protein [Paraburkholderia bannensis]